MCTVFAEDSADAADAGEEMSEETEESWTSMYKADLHKKYEKSEASDTGVYGRNQERS